MVAGFAEKKEFVGCRGLIGTDELRCQLILSKCFGVQTNSMSRSRSVTISIGWGAPNKDGRNMLQRQWWCWHLRQLQPAADIGARKKPVEKHGSEVHVQVSGDVRDSGDPVQEFASFRNLGPQTPAEGSH